MGVLNQSILHINRVLPDWKKQSLMVDKIRLEKEAALRGSFIANCRTLTK